MLNYPLTHHVKAGFKRAWKAMADVQFAAGARDVLPLHEQATPYTSPAEAARAIQALSDVPHHMGAGSAHVMGGCPMSASPDKGVVDQHGRHWSLNSIGFQWGWRNI